MTDLKWHRPILAVNLARTIWHWPTQDREATAWMACHICTPVRITTLGVQHRKEHAVGDV